MKGLLIAVAFATAVAAAGASARALFAYVPSNANTRAGEHVLPGISECLPSEKVSAAASSASAIIDAYLRFHAEVRAYATIADLPGGGVASGATPMQSNCTSEGSPALRDGIPAPDPDISDPANPNARRSHRRGSL